MTLESTAFGKYKIIKELGRSNDVVYEAVDLTINRRIALKELIIPQNLSGAQKRERIERFYREARAAGSLTHPNIVTIYEVGEENNRHYIAMEYLEGQSLRSILDIEKTLSIEKTLNIARQICDALEYAHSRGIIHRDIKPDNIQILSGDRVKITDFGIARIMEEPSITIDGQVFGTPSYMSPEQVVGKSLDSRSDIFSLGIVLYEMLTGRKPFVGDSVVSITYNIINQEISLPVGLSDYFTYILSKCLSKDRDNRYRSVKELANDLSLDTYNNLMNMQDPRSSSDSVPVPQDNTVQNQSAAVNISTRFDNHSVSGQSYIKNIIFNAQNAYYFKITVVIILIAAFFIGFVFLIMAGYNGFQKRQNIEQISSYMQLGRQYYDQQSYESAIEQFTLAIGSSNDPELVKLAKRNISVCYIKMGNNMDRQQSYFQAINYYRQAVNTDPSFPEAYLNLGIALRNTGNDDEAIQMWTKTTQVGFGSSTANIAKEYIAIIYHERGDNAFRQGDKDMAINWWKSAIETAPGTQAGMMAQQKIDRVLGNL